MFAPIWLLVVGIVLLGLSCFAYGQPRVIDRVAFWNQHVGGLDESADRFFAQVYQELRDRLDLYGVSLSGLEFGPKDLFEKRTVFSARPRYLCARYSHLTYYLYVSPTPAGFYLSSSVFSKYVRGNGENKLVNLLANLYVRRETLFQHDAVIMFTESVQTVVLDVLDRYLEEKELKPLESYERRPVYHEFYRSATPPVPAPLIDAAALLQAVGLQAGALQAGGHQAGGPTGGQAAPSSATPATPLATTPLATEGAGA